MSVTQSYKGQAKEEPKQCFSYSEKVVEREGSVEGKEGATLSSIIVGIGNFWS